MSSAHGTDTHHPAGGDHVPHVLPLSVYFGVWAALMVFTVLTVGASYVDLGRTGNIIVAVAIATMKAGMVAAIFMHLAFDKKFNTIIFLSALVFLGIFIAFTMFDTETRGMTDRVAKARPYDSTAPFSANQKSSFDGSIDSVKLKQAGDALNLGEPILPGNQNAIPAVVPAPAPSAPEAPKTP